MKEHMKMKEHNIAIVADTGSDMLIEEAKELGIVLIPMKVRFGEEEFDDGVTISRDEFYMRLIESDVLPKTSQITPFMYEEYFRREVDAGREVICLTLSSKVSGCYQSALIAASSFDGHVHVVDTLQFCGPEHLLVQRAAQLRDEGKSVDEIVAAIEEERKIVRVVAVFDTLEYVKLGGRISAAAANIGSLLSIKPVVTIQDGEVAIIGKARGSKNGNNHLNKLVQQSGGIDFGMPLLLSWSGLSDTLLEKYVEDSKTLYEGIPSDQLPRSRVGAVIGTYSGPGAIALSFYPNNR